MKGGLFKLMREHRALWLTPVVLGLLALAGLYLLAHRSEVGALLYEIF